jgi:hypothetical protein
MEFIILTGLLYTGYTLNKNKENENEIQNNIEFPLNYLQTKHQELENKLPSQNIYNYSNSEMVNQIDKKNANDYFQKIQNPYINDTIPSVVATDYQRNYSSLDEIQAQDEKRMFMQKYSDNWHNNMTPFYRGESKQNMNFSSNEILLDRYNGIEKEKKQEIPNMFEITPNLTNVFGDTSQLKNLENSKERYQPSLYQQNVQPIESIKVGPGLNLEPETVARQGWQEMTRILPPTTNELRTLNKPKEEYKGRILNGKFINTNRGLFSKVTKDKNSLIVENFAGERNFKTTGAYLKAMSNSNYCIKENKKHQEILLNAQKGNIPKGPSYSASALKIASRNASIQPSRKNTYETNYVGAITSSTPYSECKKESYFAKNTFRQEYEDQNPISNIVSMITKSIIRPTQKLKITKKQQSIINNKESGNIFLNSKNTSHFVDSARKTIKQDTAIIPQSNSNIYAPGSSIVYNPESKLKKTIKESTLSPSEPNNPFSNSAVQVYNPEIKAKQTIKEQTCQEYSNTNLYSNQQGPIKSNEKLPTTNKELTICESSRLNLSNTNQGNLVYDPNDKLKTTLKQTTIIEAPNMNINGGKYVGVSYDPDHLTKTTVKQTTLSENTFSNLKDGYKGIAYDPEQITKTTINQTTLHETPNSNLNNVSYGLPVYDPSNVFKTTNKEIISNIENSHGNITNGYHKSIVYNTDEIIKPTIKETIIQEYQPTNISTNVQSNSVFNYNNKLKSTIKETTLQESSHSNLTSKNEAGIVYDPNQLAKPTMNECTMSEQPISNLSTTTPSVVVYDPCQVAKSTVKESTLHEQPFSNVGTTISSNIVYDPCQTAKHTVKETTIQEQPLSNVSTIVKSNQIYDPCQTTKHTIKETTLLENYKGNVSSKDLQSGAYKTLKIKPRYTSRQDIENDVKNNYVGNATTNGNQSTNQQMYKNMTTNALKEKIAVGRDPTLSGSKKNISLNEYGQVSVNKNSENSFEKYKKPTLFEEFEYFKINQGNQLGNKSLISSGITINEVGSTTKDKNIYEIENQIDPSILDAFNNNPYTQSLSSAI